MDENGADTTAVESRATAVRAVLRRFQEGYKTRDLAELDVFMDLFVSGDQAEPIDIAATEPGGYEWFRGSEAIRGVIETRAERTYDGGNSIPTAPAARAGEGAGIRLGVRADRRVGA